MKKKVTQMNLERFVMNMPDIDIATVEKIARENGCTMSWIYRSILKALDKQYHGHFPDGNGEIKRPKKFDVPFRQTVVCFYGDKCKWMNLTRIWHMELGPLIRFGLGLYYAGKLNLDLEKPNTVKEVRNSSLGKKTRKRNNIKKNRYTYLYQNSSICYVRKDFWEKNARGNISLMEWGLANRKIPLVLPKWVH